GGQPVEGGSIAEQDPQWPRIQRQGQRNRYAEVLGFSAKRPQRGFYHDGVAWMSSRLGRLRPLQLDAAPARKRIDVQVDALDVPHSCRIAVNGLEALAYSKRRSQGRRQL